MVRDAMLPSLPQIQTNKNDVQEPVSSLTSQNSFSTEGFHKNTKLIIEIGAHRDPCHSELKVILSVISSLFQVVSL